jgi:hypothetical protein
MENNPFAPFQILEQTKYKLHLIESNNRKLFLFLFFRIFPIILFVTIASTIVAFELPLEFKLILSLIAVLQILMFKQQYVTELVLDSLFATIRYHTIFGTKNVTIMWKEVEAITLESYYFNPGAGDFYRIKLKGIKRQVPMLTIPFLSIRVESREKINEVINQITGFKI